MRKCLCLLLFVFISGAKAQDTMDIVYSQEPDTLIRQRFVDKYENIFMTKVPTRHMLKMGVGQSALTYLYMESIFAMNHEVGYEYKISQAFSAGINLSLDGQIQLKPSFMGAVSWNIYGRWYYDMKRSIQYGRSANNFSGNFFSVVAERRVVYQYYTRQPVLKVGVEFGMQRRFLNHGRLELGVGTYYQNDGTTRYRSMEFPILNWASPQENFKSPQLVIATRSHLSMAFGDWRSSGKGSHCEILKCDQSVNQQWKIMWPNLGLGLKFIQATVAFGYEKKLKSSPFSLNTQILAYYYSNRNIPMVEAGSFYHKRLEINASAQLRYYYLQKHKIRTGRGGNNLSGIYVGPHIDYINFLSARGGSSLYQTRHAGLGLTYGFQKTLFKNFYIDANGSLSWNIFDRANTNTALRIGFGLLF